MSENRKETRLWEGFIKSTRRVPSAMRNIIGGISSEGKSSLELLLGEPGIVVTRKLKCCCCGHVFEAEAGLRKFDEVGHRDRDFSAAVGEIPV